MLVVSLCLFGGIPGSRTCLRLITGYGSPLRGERVNWSPMLTMEHGKILKITNNVLVHKQHGLDNLGRLRDDPNIWRRVTAWTPVMLSTLVDHIVSTTIRWRATTTVFQEVESPKFIEGVSTSLFGDCIGFIQNTTVEGSDLPTDSHTLVEPMQTNQLVTQSWQPCMRMVFYQYEGK